MRNKIEIGKICKSNKDGDFKILSKAFSKHYRGSKVNYYNIEFVNTGYKTISHAESIRCGQIKDYLKPCLHRGWIGKRRL